MNRSRMAAAALRSSYFIFAGLLLMIFAGPVVASLGSENSLVAAGIMYLFALGWQVFVIILNPKRLVTWIMLIGYVAIASIPLIGSLFPKT